MKKLVYSMMALVALLLVSCQNEDISVSRETVFSVNPYEAITGFVNHQLNEGDLDLLPSSARVRVQVLLYDTEGKLVDYAVEYLNNYHLTMNATFDLEDGNYVAIATTDVVYYDGTVNFEFWNFVGKEKLSEFKINHAGYLGYENKILGVGHLNVNVQSGQNSFSIPVEPQGALAVNIIWGIHSFNDVTSYDLMTDKAFNCLAFSEDGTCTVYCEDAIFNKYVYRFNPDSYSSYGGYGYQFIPTGNSSFRWDAETAEETLEDITGGPKSMNIVAGGMYQIELQLPELTFTIARLSGSKGQSLPNGELSSSKDSQRYVGVVD